MSVLPGSSIRRLRRARGWTQRELAGRLSTDAVTVSRWERGVTKPRPGARARLRALLSVREGGSLDPLIETLGDRAAARALRRAILLARPPAKVRFAADPATRLGEVERAVADQLDLRRRFNG